MRNRCVVMIRAHTASVRDARTQLCASAQRCITIGSSQQSQMSHSSAVSTSSVWHSDTLMVALCVSQQIEG